MSTDRTAASVVTLRAPWVMIAIGLPLVLFFDVGLIWGIVDAIRTGDADYPFRSSGIHGVGVVIGWSIVAIILVPCLAATVNLPMLRVRFADHRIRMRKFFRYTTIRMDDLTSVVVTDPAAWRVNGFRSSVAPRLELRATSPSGRRAYIGLNAKFLDYTAALRWLTPWLRAHPDRTDTRTLTLLEHLDDPPATKTAQERVPIDAMDLVHRLEREERNR